MKLCFIGGGNPLTGELDEVMRHLSNAVEPEDKMLIIPFATESDRVNRWFHSAKKSFEEIGLQSIKLLDDRLSIQAMQEEINQHDILYFTGGRPEKLMEGLTENELIQTVKDFPGLMVGVSAGALAFCKDCLITKDEDYPETHVIPGLGLVDFSVEVHYEEAIDEELLPLSDDREIYAIPNGSAIFFKEETITTVHPVFQFRKRDKKIVS